MFAIQYGLIFCLYMRSLYSTIILSFQYKYQAARSNVMCKVNIGMSYSVIDGLVSLLHELMQSCGVASFTTEMAAQGQGQGQRSSIRELDLMSKYWNELLRH